MKGLLDGKVPHGYEEWGFLNRAPLTLACGTAVWSYMCLYHLLSCRLAEGSVRSVSIPPTSTSTLQWCWAYTLAAYSSVLRPYDSTRHVSAPFPSRNIPHPLTLLGSLALQTAFTFQLRYGFLTSSFLSPQTDVLVPQAVLAILWLSPLLHLSSCISVVDLPVWFHSGAQTGVSKDRNGVFFEVP